MVRVPKSETNFIPPYPTSSVGYGEQNHGDFYTHGVNNTIKQINETDFSVSTLISEATGDVIHHAEVNGAGSEIYYEKNGKSVFGYDIASGSQKFSYTARSSVGEIDLSPKGLAVVEKNDGVTVLDPETGSVKWRQSPTSSDSARWLRNGNLLLITDQADYYLYTPDGELIQIISTGFDDVYNVIPTEGSQFVAWESQDSANGVQEAARIDSEDGSEVWRTADLNIEGVSLLFDGDEVVFFGANGIGSTNEGKGDMRSLSYADGSAGSISVTVNTGVAITGGYDSQLNIVVVDNNDNWYRYDRAGSLLASGTTSAGSEYSYSVTSDSGTPSTPRSDGV